MRFLDLSALIKAFQMTLTLPPLIPPFYPRSCRHCLYALGAIIPPLFRQIRKVTFSRYFFNMHHSSRTTKAHLLIQAWKRNPTRKTPSFLRLIGSVYFKRHATGFDTQIKFTGTHTSNTKHGWKTYGKLLQIEAHLILKWSLPMKLSTISLEEIMVDHTHVEARRRQEPNGL